MLPRLALAESQQAKCYSPCACWCLHCTCLPVDTDDGSFVLSAGVREGNLLSDRKAAPDIALLARGRAAPQKAPHHLEVHRLNRHSACVAIVGDYYPGHGGKCWEVNSVTFPKRPAGGTDPAKHGPEKTRCGAIVLARPGERWDLLSLTTESCAALVFLPAFSVVGNAARRAVDMALADGDARAAERTDAPYSSVATDSQHATPSRHGCRVPGDRGTARAHYGASPEFVRRGAMLVLQRPMRTWHSRVWLARCRSPRLPRRNLPPLPPGN